ncbi:carbamoyltransferase HypF [Helicobacter valdiviensis]|uniref:Carbamoyltransferase n=1 Tax=Helicobacter valdiviensis TaxID=1458358 RepID=A0A2W6MWK8_9HELI|nr:carbamoyltransferase HypF [Helicobacter valdiviensis]PZT48905.1 carbamoyltransferase HypF [Helicobacter valdiviensis]
MLKIQIEGIVQGVGFRPFVQKMALKYGIKGYCLNNSKGVLIIAQNKDTKKLEDFCNTLLNNPPKAALIQKFHKQNIPSYEDFCDFQILKSQDLDKKTAIIPADIALCKECLKEFLNPKDRRYLYPFISCTNCGGRYSLIHSLPYDREKTSMRDFKMCKTCKEEYEDINSRRFHSEINCCKECGPKLYFTKELKNTDLLDSKISLPLQENPLQEAIAALKRGEILALKGIGGYALVCDAYNKEAIKRLRERKNRKSKPFALMFENISKLQEILDLQEEEITLLSSPKAPILLSRKLKKEANLLPLDVIAPSLKTLGVILPYSPIHHLLLREFKNPLIFTSANLSGEPIIKNFSELSKKLSCVCDGVLFYNRDILNAIDDSLVQIIDGKEQILRRARGYALDISTLCKIETKEDFASLGAEQKSTFCFCHSHRTLLSPHLGDLNTLDTFLNFKNTLELFSKTYKSTPKTYVLDLHPRYHQRNLLEGKQSIEVQHHFAHLLSNIAENQIQNKTIGVIFDGTGYGSDGKIWGGEFLEWNPKTPLEFKRIGSFAPFKLLGGENAIKDIRRLGLEGLFASFQEDYTTLKLPLLKEFSKEELEVFYSLHFSKITPICSSVGRLFDMVGAILGVCKNNSYEGEAGSILQSLVMECKTKAIPYSFSFENGIVHWHTMIKQITKDLNKIPLEQIALNFHYTLAKVIKEVICHATKEKVSIALSGGCFANALLSELTIKELAPFKVYLNHQIPCNDGGISYGQAYFMYLLQNISQ